MNQYPLWKYLLVAIVLAIAVLYALPNVFGSDPAVQVSRTDNEKIAPALVDEVRSALERRDLAYRGVELADGRVLARFVDEATQIDARRALVEALGDAHVVALNLAPRTPEWLRAIGAEQVSLGLDLRGGVHFLMEVDMQGAIRQAMERYASDTRRLLREERLRYGLVEQDGDSVVVRMRDPSDVPSARDVLAGQYSELDVERVEGGDNALRLTLTEQERRSIKETALEQNITTLRNRVNELGVSEPIVQRQGQSRVVVQLPGVQDTARAKEILGTTATLEWRLVSQEGDPQRAARTGDVPLGTELFRTDDGRPVLLEREMIVTGENLVDASSGFDNRTGGPAVTVTLDGEGASRMGDVTQENIGEPMAVLFVETKLDTRREDGELVTERSTEREVISIATIQDAFSKRFQITGLSSGEAQNLALLLRAGTLAAPIDIIEERTVGPSLGQENIEQGLTAVVVGFLLVIVFMALYYKVFGLFANVALLTNLVVIVAVLSMLQATLTLPGIAGIVLTVGMAVDANVLIFERIREELANGNTPQASIHSGYQKALSTIADANITTLIAAVVLFSFGTGPIRGFAITLSIGILSSMFTAIMGTRALTNLTLGGRRLARLHI